MLTDVPKNTIFKKNMHQGGYMAVHYEIKMHIDDNQVAGRTMTCASYWVMINRTDSD